VAHKVGQYFIMSFNQRLIWRSFETYELLNAQLRNEPVFDQLNEYKVVILYHTGSSMTNKLMGSFIKTVVNIREHKGLITLLLTLVPVDSSYGIDVIDFKSLAAGKAEVIHYGVDEGEKKASGKLIEARRRVVKKGKGESTFRESRGRHTDTLWGRARERARTFQLSAVSLLPLKTWFLWRIGLPTPRQSFLGILSRDFLWHSVSSTIFRLSSQKLPFSLENQTLRL
jgi:hypothetical protein